MIKHYVFVYMNSRAGPVGVPTCVLGKVHAVYWTGKAPLKSGSWLNDKQKGKLPTYISVPRYQNHHAQMSGRYKLTSYPKSHKEDVWALLSEAEVTDCRKIVVSSWFPTVFKNKPEGSFCLVDPLWVSPATSNSENNKIQEKVK